MQPLKTVYRQTVVSFSEGAKKGQIDKLLETYTNTVNYMNLHYNKILQKATPNMGVFPIYCRKAETVMLSHIGVELHKGTKTAIKSRIFLLCLLSSKRLFYLFGGMSKNYHYLDFMLF